MHVLGLTDTSTTMDTGGTNSPLCIHFSRGACTRGDTCHFSHTRSAALPAPRTTAFPKAPCKFFLNGACRNGDQCQFDHPNTSQNLNQGSRGFSGRVVGSPLTGISSDSWRSKNNAPSRPITRAHNLFSTTVPCKFFAQGHCTKGTQCPFTHEVESAHRGVFVTKQTDGPVKTDLKVVTQANTPVVRVDEGGPEPSDDSNIIKRTLFGCKVAYGDGAAIQEVITPFESQFITVSNLPRDITDTKLLALAECFGNVEFITIDKLSPVSPTAQIKFAILEDATRAVKGLNGEMFESKKLIARLDRKAVEDGLATLRSTKVKVSWFAPSLRTWAHYNGISTARQQALMLDGRSYNGSTISATFQTPTRRQTDSFSVEIRGLPRSPNNQQLKAFCHANSVTVGSPNYVLSAARAEMETLLSRYGKLESFEVLPLDPKKAKTMAFAQFRTPDAAQRAVEELHSTKQDFLGGGPVWLENVHTLKYMIPALQFSVLKPSINSYRDSQSDCKINYYEVDESGQACDPVCIRVFGSQVKSLGMTKATLDGLLKGEPFIVTGASGLGGWDEYSATPEGQFFLRNLIQKTKGYVKCDSRSRTVHLFGSTPARQALKVALELKVTELAERRHILYLDRTQLRSLLSGGYKKLTPLVGEKNLVLDVVKRTLTIMGDEGNVKKVRGAMYLGLQSPAQEGTSGTIAGDEDLETDCPVCFCDPVEPVLLPCGHSYCKLCLQHLLRAASSNSGSSVVSCVKETLGDSSKVQTCGAGIPTPIFRMLLTPAEEEDLLKATFLSYVHSRPQEFHYCPSPDCQIIYRQGEDGTVLRCPSCISRICASCHVEFHEGQTCGDYRDFKSGGNELFQRWRKEHNAKPCPKCGAVLEKNGGCNHMTCIRCKAHICWVCMRTFSNSDGGNGVYSHMRAEHGGI